MNIRKRLGLWIALILVPLAGMSDGTVQPKIMVVPYVKQGQDIRTVLEEDTYQRITMAKIKEGFDSRGFTTVDFEAKYKAINTDNAMAGAVQQDLKTAIIQQSGADIYVEAEVMWEPSDNGNQVKLTIQGYDVSTANSLANKVGESGKFYSTDVGKLVMRALTQNNTLEDFLNTLQTKFTDMVENGKSVKVECTVAQGAAIALDQEIGDDGSLVSDKIEEWMGENAYKGIYHIQGTTAALMSFDDVRIPLKDEKGNTYNLNKFALAFARWAKQQGLTITRSIKNGTLYITFK